MYHIKCCKDCVPPQRNSTCHSTCEQYREEKARMTELKKKIAKQKNDDNLLLKHR